MSCPTVSLKTQGVSFFDLNVCAWMCNQANLSGCNVELFLKDWLQIFWGGYDEIALLLCGETHLSLEFCLFLKVICPNEANGTISSQQTESSLPTVCLLRCFLICEGFLGQRWPSIFNILSAFRMKLHHRVQDFISCTGMKNLLYE